MTEEHVEKGVSAVIIMRQLHSIENSRHEKGAED